MHDGHQTSDVRVISSTRHVTLGDAPRDVGAQPAVAPVEVPARDPWALIDRRQLRIRPIDAEDRARLAELFDRMSPESRLRRFLTPKPRLSSSELAYLTDVDHVAHEALAAVDQRDGSIVGVVRYVRCGDRPGVADMAIEVADELQGMGIGTLLGRRLIERACANGVELLAATTLWENRPARALLRRLGFQARSSQGTEIRLELALAAQPTVGPGKTVG